MQVTQQAAHGTQATDLAQAIRRVAETASTEEDLRIGVEQALAPVRQVLGITPRYERTYPATVSVLGGGSSDAVYGHAVIEYKKPGVLSRKGGPEEAIWGRKDRTGKRRGGLVQYMQGEAAHYGGEREKALRRIIGIGIDGQNILFLRYRGDKRPPPPAEPPLPSAQLALFELPAVKGGFQPMGPYPVTEESISLLLAYLRALRRRPLTPEALADDFGPKGGIARDMVATLYERLVDALTQPNNPYPQAATLFSEWDRIFGIVYGQDIAKARQDASELAKLYGLSGSEELKPLLFAVHTYYALLMKFLAAELASLQSGSLVSSFVADLPALSGKEIQDRLADLEDGGLFARMGIHNFLEGDFFGWYLGAWHQDLEGSIRDMARALSDYEPATGSLQPEATRDLLKKLYQYLIPRELRHDLGEYYTPDWLAELVLDEVGYEGHLDSRVLDPACGSGTFLVLAIRRARDYADEKLIEPRETVGKILANIVGFDLNPLAVIAARTNYLLALGNLVRYKDPVEIPVYICDSILTPAQEAKSRPLEHQNDIPVPSVVREFWIPEEVVESGQVEAMTMLLENCVRRGYVAEEFLEQCHLRLKLRDSSSKATLATLATLYEKVLGLEREGRNGIWARIVKNAFAPIFQGRFDYVVGNPPWVLWGYLADEYRNATKRLWVDYGLFSLKGMAARLGSGEKDLSMLFTYACADAYLQHGGLLGFVITQEVFKAKGKGEGFRRFRLGEEGSHLGVLKAHDMVSLKPFEGAANKTAAIFLEKGRETTYPVPYFVWHKRPGSARLDTSLSLDEALTLTERQELRARPVGDSSVNPWQTVSEQQTAALQKLRGKPTYQARRGASTEPYGVYWLRLRAVRADGELVVENLPEMGKRPIRKVEASLESALVFPAVRGADIRRWQAKSEVYVLVVQDPETREGYPEARMKVKWPNTYGYLLNFKDELLSRGSRPIRELAERTVFYSMYGIGSYTFAPYKVVWKRMASDMVATVLTFLDTPFGKKPAIPTDTTSLIACNTSEEAHFLCALLNSAPARTYISSFSSAGRGFGAPSIITHMSLPGFDSTNTAHRRLAALSAKAHQLAAQGEGGEAELRRVETEIDRLAAQLWGITTKELAEIHQALAQPAKFAHI